MSPAIESGDRLNVDTGYYVEHPLSRGDIIVFRAPDERAFVKRVVGLPGETIKLDRAVLLVNGKRLEEMTLKGSSTITDNIKLGSDELYVLGDNYAHSYDSRYIGPVRKSSVIGKVTKIERKRILRK
jgi:signal peptidase I